MWFIVWRSDAVVIQHKSVLVIQYHAKIVKTKSPFDISLFSKLKHAAILLLNYIVNCEKQYYTDSLCLNEYTKTIGLKRKRHLFGAEKLK